MSKKLFTKRRAARFFAVQALYQQKYSDTSIDALIMEFSKLHLHENNPDSIAGDADKVLFSHIIRGVFENIEAIDESIRKFLLDGWPLERLDAVILAFLRAGTFEILFDLETPLPVIIHEYLEIAKTFFDQGEVSFLNVTLDKIGKAERAG